MVYLFIGQDLPAKDIALKRIKKESFPEELAQFNFEVLYAEELSLKLLQERLLAIPVKSAKTVLLIKNAQALKKPAEDFILEWAKKQDQHTVLVLDINRQEESGAFIRGIADHARIIRFKEKIPLNTFNLSRQIEEGQADYALKILSQLIEDGEPAERILGGLRYSLESNALSVSDMRRRLKLLLNCDIEIKTGKLKPVFALEKLVVNLCALSQVFH